MNQLHDQIEIVIKGSPVEVDAHISVVVDWINNRLGVETYESCENYGEYLRDLGFDHVFESKRSYAYIEFFEWSDAMTFLDAVVDRTGVAHPFYHQIANEGTPEAWELKMRPSTGNFWLWFPAAEIDELEKILYA